MGQKKIRHQEMERRFEPLASHLPGRLPFGVPFFDPLLFFGFLRIGASCRRKRESLFSWSLL